ncbi:hypothetical protein [Desulfosporosinus sp. SB140]
MLYGELKKYRALITFDSLTQAIAAENVFKIEQVVEAVLKVANEL